MKFCKVITNHCQMKQKNKCTSEVKMNLDFNQMNNSSQDASLLFAVFSSAFTGCVFRFSEAPWDISVFNHVHYLTLHRDVEQYAEVEHQHRPEDRDVEYAKKCHNVGGNRATYA